MQFTLATLAVLFSSALAMPYAGNGGGSDYVACPTGLFSVAQCCSANVLGVAALDCEAPSSTPTSAADFSSICKAKGRTALCCVLPVAGLDLLCEEP